MGVTGDIYKMLHTSSKEDQNEGHLKVWFIFFAYSVYNQAGGNIEQLVKLKTKLENI